MPHAPCPMPHATASARERPALQLRGHLGQPPSLSLGMTLWGGHVSDSRRVSACSMHGASKGAMQYTGRHAGIGVLCIAGIGGKGLKAARRSAARTRCSEGLQVLRGAPGAPRGSEGLQGPLGHRCVLFVLVVLLRSVALLLRFCCASVASHSFVKLILCS